MNEQSWNVEGRGLHNSIIQPNECVGRLFIEKWFHEIKLSYQKDSAREVDTRTFYCPISLSAIYYPLS